MSAQATASPQGYRGRRPYRRARVAELYPHFPFPDRTDLSNGRIKVFCPSCQKSPDRDAQPGLTVWDETGDKGPYAKCHKTCDGASVWDAVHALLQWDDPAPPPTQWHPPFEATELKTFSCGRKIETRVNGPTRGAGHVRMLPCGSNVEVERLPDPYPDLPTHAYRLRCGCGASYSQLLRYAVKEYGHVRQDRKSVV